MLAGDPLIPGWLLPPSKLHIPDRDKYSTLHTCGPKILPGEEDGVVVVLGVRGVGALLRVRPAAHLLQAARRIAALDQAHRLQGEREIHCWERDTQKARHASGG